MEDKGNISQELLETIERYLKGNMTAEEHASFEEKLDGDTVLRQNVEDLKIILLGIETSVFKDKLNTFHEDLPQNEPGVKENSKVRNFPFLKYAAAASIALLVGFGGWWMMNKKSDNEKLFTKYFKPDPGLATTMSGNNNFEFYDAMVNYKQGDYDLAVEKWMGILPEKPKNDTLNYFLGVAHLANGDDSVAISYLKEVSKIENTVFEKEAFYYLGLAYLKNGNKSEAKKNLSRSEIDKSKLILDELED